MNVGPICPWPQAGVDVVIEVVRGEHGAPHHLSQRHRDEAEVAVGSQS